MGDHAEPDVEEKEDADGADHSNANRCAAERSVLTNGLLCLLEFVRIFIVADLRSTPPGSYTAMMTTVTVTKATQSISPRNSYTMKGSMNIGLPPLVPNTATAATISRMMLSTSLTIALFFSSKIILVLI